MHRVSLFSANGSSLPLRHIDWYRVRDLMSPLPSVLLALFNSTAGEVTVPIVVIHSRSPSYLHEVGVLNNSQPGWQQSLGWFIYLFKIGWKQKC